MIKRQTLHGKITQGIPEKCLNHLRIPDPEDCPKMADGQPLGFCVVRVRNCPRCNDYKTCKLKCRLPEKALAKHEKWLAKYDKEKQHGKEQNDRPPASYM